MIIIRELKTIEEMEQVQELECKVWEMPPTPSHQTLTAVKNGGIMVGAFDGSRLIGFSYGFAGFRDGQSYLCSHMLGIDEDYRSHGIGEKLKLKQREIAITKGYDTIHWTYDPLETRNGYLNLTKLNGICDTYIENCYGEMKNVFNQGLPSDRFEVHWHLTSPYVVEKHLPMMDRPAAINTISFNEEGLPVYVAGIEQDLNSPAYSLAVPKDFQALKAASQSLAMDWRTQTRTQFQRLFKAGYATVQLQPNETHNRYIFVKKETLALGGETK
ncbi:GNAT family N-acetyltransferase [Paenibacillus sp. BSR1-1]|uniref:GNAT family N-acetyltransferase n=1 Tax=Paenibacillus sp. BSR1-1 TaxID=3020845 RepID=UPI0025B12664|nr:GNAT family N-acetyltransferase [Paenibacillus sp. BSR1-1]MDN3014670.1 GNAT family N-acetyltransferase [Paenibacillus sp. BSR1-1]